MEEVEVHDAATGHTYFRPFTAEEIAFYDTLPQLVEPLEE